MYYGDKWNPKNDPSYDGLKIYDNDDAFFGTGNEVRADKICVYSDGVLVGGTEPDGSTPATTTSSTGSEILWGDANLDGSVDVADAVAVASFVGNSDKNVLESQGLLSADVHSNGNGINANDALVIQQYLSGTITELPA